MGGDRELPSLYQVKGVQYFKEGFFENIFLKNPEQKIISLFIPYYI